MRSDIHIPKQNNKIVIVDIIVLVVLLAIIVAAFFSFARTNSRRALEQTDSFIEASAIQTAERLNDKIYTARQSVNLLSMLYSANTDGPAVNKEILRDMTDRSSFDYVEFIDRNGKDLTPSGQTADLSDREHFKDGMAGNSGKTFIKNSRITNETLLVFYEPARYNGEITGVFTGMIRADVLAEDLSVDYFGLQGSMYLVERNGDVILSTRGAESPENLIEHYEKNGMLTDNDLQKLKEALHKNDVDFNSFNFQTKNGTGSGYVKILDDDWALVMTFPSKVTQEMTRSANEAGMNLQIQLGAVFIAYVLYIICKNSIQKHRLVTEKQEMADIVDATTGLFSRFALVDFETDTYRYLEDKFSDVPKKGKYSQLVEYLDKKYISEVEGTEKMSVRISRDYVCQNLTEDTPYLQYEYQIDIDGKRWENVSILCLKRKEGVPVNVLYAIQDVTALKEHESEIRLALRNASDAAAAANNAKSDFLARMSHDIRTPMNAIMGMTAVAAMHMDDKERLTDCLNKITVSSRHLLALINDVLDMSKIESGKVTLSEEPFSIADLVDSIVTIMRQQINSKHHDFSVQISNIVHENVVGDTLRLRQIFVNILGNAVKFTPENGKISFSIRELNSSVNGMACYEFVCEDTGIGMDEEFIKTIFDPFSRSKQSDVRKTEGTGLGMSITRNIVLMMDGDIDVKSAIGKGSTFTVRLYLKIQDVQLYENDIKALADLNVLVADDEESAGCSACETLKSIGMNATWVSSGDEAVKSIVNAHENGHDFSAVILDWKMPEKDGIETAREIRKNVGEELPIIILSAYDWTDIENEARAAGIQAFIGKPLFRSRLIYALKSVLFPEKLQVPVGGEENTDIADYSKKRVLLAEDNELNREIARELLSMTGVKIDEAENGSQAVKSVSEHEDGYYDLIFMDIQMPIMDGYEAARQIRGLNCQTPIVAMTANAFADDIREAHSAGMNDHMSKPVELPKILEYMAKYIR